MYGLLHFRLADRSAKVGHGNRTSSSTNCILNSSCERNLCEYAIRLKVSETEEPNTVRTQQEKKSKRAADMLAAGLGA